MRPKNIQLFTIGHKIHSTSLNKKFSVVISTNKLPEVRLEAITLGYPWQCVKYLKCWEFCHPHCKVKGVKSCTVESLSAKPIDWSCFYNWSNLHSAYNFLLSQLPVEGSVWTHPEGMILLRAIHIPAVTGQWHRAGSKWTVSECIRWHDAVRSGVRLPGSAYQSEEILQRSDKTAGLNPFRAPNCEAGPSREYKLLLTLDQG